MPTYRIDFETSRRFKGKLREQKDIFAMTEGIAKKMFYNWAKFTMKRFARIINIEQV